MILILYPLARFQLEFFFFKRYGRSSAVHYKASLFLLVSLIFKIFVAFLDVKITIVGDYEANIAPITILSTSES